MQERYTSFDALENALLERLKARGCSSITVTGYRYLCNSIISWLKDKGLESYTKEGGNTFLQDYLCNAIQLSIISGVFCHREPLFFMPKNFKNITKNS